MCLLKRGKSIKIKQDFNDKFKFTAYFMRDGSESFPIIRSNFKKEERDEQSRYLKRVAVQFFLRFR